MSSQAWMDSEWTFERWQLHRTSDAGKGRFGMFQTTDCTIPTNKLRVVLDIGSVYQGTSLNDQLLQRPILTTLIRHITIFRQEPVAIMAGLEAMLHQVKVTPEDADLLLFFWWLDENDNMLWWTTGWSCTYLMLIHYQSVFITNYALKT